MKTPGRQAGGFFRLDPARAGWDTPWKNIAGSGFQRRPPGVEAAVVRPGPSTAAVTRSNPAAGPGRDKIDEYNASREAGRREVTQANDIACRDEPTLKPEIQ